MCECVESSHRARKASICVTPILKIRTMEHRGLEALSRDLAEVRFKPDVSLQSCHSMETPFYHWSEKAYSLRRSKRYLMTLPTQPLMS